MAGYHGYSMSNNAVDAYADGRMPLSRITLAVLREAGWTETLALAKWLARTESWECSEWHHTSKEFHTTDFYDPAELVEWWQGLDDDDRTALTELYVLYRPAKQQLSEERVHGTYTEFSGSRNHPKLTKHDFTGTKKGGWIYLDGGGKKKATGRYIAWRYDDA